MRPPVFLQMVVLGRARSLSDIETARRRMISVEAATLGWDLRIRIHIF